MDGVIMSGAVIVALFGVGVKIFGILMNSISHDLMHISKSSLVMNQVIIT